MKNNDALSIQMGFDAFSVKHVFLEKLPLDCAVLLSMILHIYKFNYNWMPLADKELWDGSIKLDKILENSVKSWDNADYKRMSNTLSEMGVVTVKHSEFVANEVLIYLNVDKMVEEFYA